MAAVDRFVAAQMANLGLPGLSLAIVGGGRIVYHRALGVADVATGAPVTGATIFEAGSLSKPVFAAFVLWLAEDGVLDLDTPLHTILPFPELAGDPRARAVTARMVLDHTTGFPNWRWYDPAPAERGIPRGTMYMKAAPGTFTYSGEAYHYLARVVAHLTGTDMTTLDDLINARVAQPLGIQDFFWRWDAAPAARKATGHNGGQPVARRWPRSSPDDDSTHVGVAGRLHTEARAYALFLLGLMGGRVVGAATLDAMLSPQSRVPPDAAGGGPVAWGLGVAMTPTPYGTRYEHGGSNRGFRSGFGVVRERAVGYVFFTNSDRGEEFGRRLAAFLTDGDHESAPPDSPRQQNPEQ